MAIKLFKVDNFYNGIHKEFLIDTEHDLEVIDDLYDCELGDKAYTVDGRIFTRHSDNFEGELWEVTSARGGSNSEQEDVAGGGLVVSPSIDEGTGKITLDKTFTEIFQAFSSGTFVVFKDDTDPPYIYLHALLDINNDELILTFSNIGYNFSATTADDYPQYGGR